MGKICIEYLWALGYGEEVVSFLKGLHYECHH